MARKKLDFRADAYRNVLGFVFRQWTHRPALVGGIIVLVVASTLAEVLVPVFSGRIVDAIAGGNAADALFAPSSSSRLSVSPASCCDGSSIMASSG